MGFILKRWPEQLYKYYSFDESRLHSRLTGKVFLAAPHQFNDPSDCRLGIRNNFSELGKDSCWLKTKLYEIGATSEHYFKGILMNDENIVNEVWKMQLKKVGILCLSQEASNKLFWGYYTNNRGFCVEYDAKAIKKKIVVGYVNCLDYTTTVFFAETKRFISDPYIRCSKKTKDEIDEAVNLFRDFDYGDIINPFLLSYKDNTKVANFIVNICLKRFGCGEMFYCPKDEIQTQSPKLFFNGDESEIIAKYYTKTQDWKNEKEFRIVASLGGGMLADLGKDVVKSIRLGCNISFPQTISILSILHREDMLNVPLYKMINDVNDIELKPVLLDNKLVYELLYKLKTSL